MNGIWYRLSYFCPLRKCWVPTYLGGETRHRAADIACEIVKSGASVYREWMPVAERGIP